MWKSYSKLGFSTFRVLLLFFWDPRNLVQKIHHGSPSEPSFGSLEPRLRFQYVPNVLPGWFVKCSVESSKKNRSNVEITMVTGGHHFHFMGSDHPSDVYH